MFVFDYLTLHVRSSYYVETIDLNPLIYIANQWNGFCMIRASIMEELMLIYKQ